MPIDEDPGGGAVTVPTTVLYTSVSGRNGPAEFTQSTLRHLDELTTYRGPKLELLKYLRVAELALHGEPERDEVNLMAGKYLAIYNEPRLSTITEAIGAFEPENLSDHLDIDWFGKPKENWWPKDAQKRGPDGRPFETKLLTALREMVEDSLGLTRSTPGDPSTWTWPGAKEAGGWKQDLANQVPDKGKAMTPIRLEWKIESSRADLDCTRADSGGTLCLRFLTPPPMDANGIQIAG